MLADTGVLGFAAFACFSVLLLRGAIPRGTSTPWQVAILAALVGWYVHGLTDYFLAPVPTALGFSLVAALSHAHRV
jgi:hypothetical protein